jgi:hypothetical protein
VPSPFTSASAGGPLLPVPTVGSSSVVISAVFTGSQEEPSGFQPRSTVRPCIAPSA